MARPRRALPVLLAPLALVAGPAAAHLDQVHTRRGLERRLARSRLGRFTPMSAVDGAWPTRLDPAAGEATLRLHFFAQAAVLAGTHVLFTTAA